MNHLTGRMAAASGAQRTFLILEARRRNLIVRRAGANMPLAGNRGNFLQWKRRFRESGEQFFLGGTSAPYPFIKDVPFELKKGETLVIQVTPQVDDTLWYDVEYEEAEK